MQELLSKMYETRERAYKEYREAELTEDEARLAHLSGVLVGMDRMIALVVSGLVKKN